MIDREWLKKTLLAMAMRVPIYKLFKEARLRDYLAIQYLNRNNAKAIPGYLSSTGRLPTFRYSTMLMALNALEKKGDQSRLAEAATQALAANPERLKPYLVLSDAARWGGDYEEAYQHARNAWMLHPGSLSAALRAVRLGYIAGHGAQADRDAIVALRRFAGDDSVLWLACKYCRSPEQLKRILSLARTPSDKPKRTSAIVRPLAAAALRAACFDDAIELYSKACIIELKGQGVGTPVSDRKLAGKGGSMVLQALREALESEGIPFFFAAGTALGLVRNGKPLGHDNDIDVGIFEQDWDRDRLIRIFAGHPDFDLDDSNPNSPKIGIVHRRGANIDLFKFYRQGDGIYHDAIFVRWKNTPFDIEKRALESGDIVYLPSNQDRYLTENYGDWRKPDKKFDAFVHGPNVEVTWPQYMEVHLLRRAYKQIRASNLVAARQELLGVKEALSRTASGRILIGGMQL